MEFRAFLKNTYLFGHLQDNELEELEQNSTEVFFARGETIYKQDSFATHALYLLKGYASVYTEIQNYQRIIKIIKPGWFIGLMSVFSMEKHLFSARAVENCVVRMIDKTTLSSLLSRNSEFSLKFIKELSLLGSSLIFYLALQNTKNVRGRIGEILLHLSENIFKSPTFPLMFTRKELGAIANTSTETAIRIINDFKREKLIEIENNVITILNIELLRKAVILG